MVGVEGRKQARPQRKVGLGWQVGTQKCAGVSLVVKEFKVNPHILELNDEVTFSV